MGRPPKSKTPLTQDIITQAALKLLDEKGESALSFRALAKTLNVSPMAIAHHTGTRRQLLTALVEKVYSGLDRPPQAQPPETTIVTLLDRYCQRVMQHPNLARAVLSDTSLMSMPLHALTAQVEHGLNELGGSRSEMATVLRLLIDYTHGFAISVALSSDTPGVDHMGMFKDYHDSLHWVLDRLKKPKI